MKENDYKYSYDDQKLSLREKIIGICLFTSEICSGLFYFIPHIFETRSDDKQTAVKEARSAYFRSLVGTKSIREIEEEMGLLQKRED